VLTKQLQGLRGIAAVLVVASHCSLALAPSYFFPAEPDGRQLLFQRPFLRVFLSSGHACVSVFFLLSGFVCALKPLRLARAEKVEEAWKSLSSSAFRRVFRLVIPCTLVTLMVWIMTQFDLFQFANTAGHPWLRDTSPRPIPGILAEITRLLLNCVSPRHTHLMLVIYLVEGRK